MGLYVTEFIPLGPSVLGHTTVKNEEVDQMKTGGQQSFLSNNTKLLERKGTQED